MAENSGIEWTHHTFNPWRGCQKVSPGCANCYAERHSQRNPSVLGIWGPDGTRVVASEDMWREPVKWQKAAAKAGERQRVFCASLADVFEDWRGPLHDSSGAPLFEAPPRDRDLGPEWWDGDDTPGGQPPATLALVRGRLFGLIDRTPNLDWLLLTKRPENIKRMMPRARVRYINENPELCENITFAPRPNVWLGTSVEDQRRADERIPHLLSVPAAVHFLSVEPLLGPVLLPQAFLDLGPRGWVIVGGESENGVGEPRPMHPDWVRSLRDQCVGAGMPFFFKQWGAFSPLSITNDGALVPAPDASNFKISRMVRWEGHLARAIGEKEDVATAFAPGSLSLRLGKVRAGRLLDGRTWDEVPGT